MLERSIKVTFSIFLEEENGSYFPWWWNILYREVIEKEGMLKIKVYSFQNLKYIPKMGKKKFYLNYTNSDSQFLIL